MFPLYFRLREVSRGRHVAHANDVADLAERITGLVKIPNLLLFCLVQRWAGDSLVLFLGAGHASAHPIGNERALEFSKAGDESEEEFALRGSPPCNN